MRALIVKEFRELRRDRRTVAMLVALPILLLVIFGYAANFSVDRLSVIAIGSEADVVAERLTTHGDLAIDLDIRRVDTEASADDVVPLLRDQEADVVVLADTPGVGAAPLAATTQVHIDGSALFTAQSATGAFSQVAARDADEFFAHSDKPLNDTAMNAAPNAESDDFVTVHFNPDLLTSWVMVPGLVGLILLFVGALITSIGLVRERESGTLEQLAVMPLSPAAIIIGKVVPYFVLAVVDMAAVTALSVFLFGVPFEGNVGLFALAATVFLFVVLGVGIMISSVSQNTGQAIQMAIMFVMPQVLLSGLIFPLESMPGAVRWLGYVLPLTWFRELAQGIMLRDAGLESLWVPLAVLVVMAVVAFGAATQRMAHSLRHGQAS